MTEYARLYQIFILVTFGFVLGYAQEVYYEQYTDADGLPSMTTYQMVQDSAGILWIGTENGLVTYNGEEFERYSHPDLNDNDIVNVTIGSNGCPLFLNLSNQLCIVENKEIRKLHDFDKNKSYDIFSTTVKDYYQEVVSFDYSVIYNVSSYSYSDSMSFQDIASLKVVRDRTVDKSKSVVWNNPKYCIYRGNEENELVLYLDSLQDNLILKTPIHINNFASKNLEGFQSVHYASMKGEHYCLTRDRKCIRIDSSFKDQYSLSKIRNLIVEDNLHFVINADRVDLFDSNTGLSKVLMEGVIINTVFLDREKSLWISTRKSGLFKISNLLLRTITIKEELQDISKFLPFENGIMVFWNDRFRIFSKDMNLLFYKNFDTGERSTATISNDDIFVISDSEYLISKVDKLVFDQNILLTDDQGYATSVKDIAIFNDQLTVAIGDRIRFAYETNGLYEYNLDKTILNIGRIYEIEYLSQQDKLFAGTSNGLFSIDEDLIVSEFIKDLKNKSISCIVESSDSSIWVGTQNDGLYRIKDGVVVQKFTESNGLLSNTINSIDTRDPFIYAATTKGATRINVNTSNGLPSDYITELCVFNEKIWLAIGKNIVNIDDDFFQTESMPPKLSLSQVFKNYQPIDFINGMKFNYDENKIDILLNNICLNSGTNKSLKYRIPNLDSTWTQIKESTIRLPSLEEGRYEVEAIGISASGQESKPINLSFEIKPPWWNTYWAWALWITIALGIISFIFNYRIKQEIQKRNYLTQINKIKDQALQLQMNPHFIFNSLNAIQGFIGTDEEEMAMNFLARFARLIRLIFEHSKGNKITLEEELEFINLYLDLEKLRFKDKVNIKITVAPEIENSKDIINVPPLLIQPIVENSFKHGLFHKKGKGNLIIDYSMKGDTLQVTIQDDGIGRVESQRITKKNIEKQSSSGIKTTLERIDLLNFGKENKLNRIKIEDLYDANGDASGTKTILNLSL